MAWLFKKNKKSKRASWYIGDRDLAGKLITPIKAYRDQQASRQKLARYEKAKDRGAEGMVDPYADHKRRAITEHLTDYIAALAAEGRDDDYCRIVGSRLGRVFTGSKWSSDYHRRP